MFVWVLYVRWFPFCVSLTLFVFVVLLFRFCFCFVFVLSFCLCLCFRCLYLCVLALLSDVAFVVVLYSPLFRLVRFCFF